MGELYKTSVGCFFLQTDERGDKTPEEFKDRVLKEANALIESGAEILLAIDRGDDDDNAHQVAMDALKSVCESVDVPVFGTGEIKRMEDVKKLLYAGCDRVALGDSVGSDSRLQGEIIGKFGVDRLVALMDDASALKAEKLRASADEEERFPLPVMALAPEKEPDTVSACSLGGYGIGSVRTESDNIVPLLEERGENESLFLVSEELLPGRLSAAIGWDELKKSGNDLVPVVVQDYRTDEVLMVAYMNEEAYNKTIETGRMTYFSRSRGELWIKGETSGHFQYVRSLTADCDLDTILAKVKQVGAACHTGARSCFFNEIAAKKYAEKNPQRVLDDVYEVIKDRKENPREGSYTNYLFDKGLDKILKKCGEEATEIVIAAKNPNSNELVYEISDFLYHVMVLMAERGISWDDITDELSRR